MNKFIFIVTFFAALPLMGKSEESSSVRVSDSAINKTVAIEKDKLWGVYDSLTVQIDSVYVLDSVVSKSLGVSTSKSSYEYDEKGLRTSATVYSFVESQWSRTSGKEWKYDNSGNKIQEIWYIQNSQTGEWKPRTKFEYAYDDNNHLISQKEFKFNSTISDWVLYTYSYEYEYDDRGNLLMSATYFSEPSNGATTGTSKSAFKYDNANNKIEEIQYSYDSYSVNWKESQTFQYTYDDSNQLISEVNIRGTFKYEKEYTSSGKLTLESSAYWNPVTDLWVIDSKTETKYTVDNKTDSICVFSLYLNRDLKMIRKTNYYYDNAGNCVLNILQTRDISAEDWITYRKTESVWSGTNLLENIEYVYDYYSKECLPTYKNEKTYNSHGDLLTETTLKWDVATVDWIPDTRRLYQYSESDLITLSQSDTWSKTANEWQGNQKYEYDYNEREQTTLIASYTYSSSLSNWIGNYKYVYAFDERGRTILNTSFTFDATAIAWIGKSKSEYTYNESTGTIYTETSSWSTNTNEWIKSTKSETTWDKYGNIILNTSSVWDVDSQNWILNQKLEQEFNENNKPLGHQFVGWDKDLNDWKKYNWTKLVYNQADLIEEISCYVGNENNEWNSTSSTLYYYSLLNQETTSLNNEYASCISVYPNPVSENFIVNLPVAIKTPALLQIVDLNGKCIMSDYVSSGERISALNLQSGIYLYRVYIEKDIYHGKLIIK